MEYFNYFDQIESHEEPDYDGLVDFFASQLTDEELEDNDLGVLDQKQPTHEDELKMIKRLKGNVINDRFKIGGYFGGYYKKLLLHGKQINIYFASEFSCSTNATFFSSFRVGSSHRNGSVHQSCA